MDFSEHLALSVPAGAVVALATGQAEAGLAFAVGAVLIDLDHPLDYWREKGFTLSIHRLNLFFGSREPRHLVLVLHGWEWPLLLLAAWAGLGLPLWAGALASGWLAHLALDQRYNLLQPWAYWFFARFQQGFKAAPLYLPHKTWEREESGKL
jgi:hypothetical protein